MPRPGWGEMKLRHYLMIGILLLAAGVGILRSQTVNYFLTLNLNQVVTALHQFMNGLTFGPTPFASLGTPANGTETWCPDCQATNPCVGSGSGAYATRAASAWNC